LQDLLKLAPGLRRDDGCTIDCLIHQAPACSGLTDTRLAAASIAIQASAGIQKVVKKTNNAPGSLYIHKSYKQMNLV
jgi:hypothetical protein